jgi:hypothetical protein
LPIHQVADGSAIHALLQSWDISVTESILASQSRALAQKAQEETKRREEFEKADREMVGDLGKAAHAATMTYSHLWNECRKRTEELDLAFGEGVERHVLDAAASALEEFKRKLETAQTEMEDAEGKLREARRRKRVADEEAGVTAASSSSSDPVSGGLATMPFGSLNECIVRDAQWIRQKKRWPQLVDPTGRTTVFLRYVR